jgi:hypothetical protein
VGLGFNLSLNLAEVLLQLPEIVVRQHRVGLDQQLAEQSGFGEQFGHSL